MTVGELHELDEVKMLVARGQEAGLLTFGQIATALTEIELESYSDALFPLDILDHARSLGNAWEPLPVFRRSADGPYLPRLLGVGTA